MPNSHRSRYQSHRIWEEGRAGLTHGSGSWEGYRPRPITTITFAALGQRNLRLSCRRCHHVRVLHCAALVFLFERKGWDDRLRSLPRRFWCSPCFFSSGLKVKEASCEFVNADPTGDPLPMPDERQWKHFTSRFRS